MQRQSVLVVLAPELLELIIREILGRDDLANLRLVCKTLKGQVDPHLFARLTIDFSKNTIPEILETIVSGTSPFVRWAKVLKVDELVPLAINVSSRSESRWLWKGEDSERERKLACQEEWLIPAIRSLVQVQRAQINPHPAEPYHDCLCALSELPRLQDLSVNFYPFSPTFGDIPLAKFSNLRRVALSSLELTPIRLEGVKRLLAQSPSITDLALILPIRRKVAGIENVGEAVEFGSLVEYAVRDRIGTIAGSSTFSPTLKKLNIYVSEFKLSSSSVRFLGALTSLTIFGNPFNAQPSFWKSLQASVIRLRELTVPALLQPVVDYLLSYSGLRDFTIYHSPWNQAEARDLVVGQFFHSVLPMHRSTMETLTIYERKAEPWIMTQPYLFEGVFLCRNLRFLKFTYYYPSPLGSCDFSIVPIVNVLGGVSENLPRLQILKLRCITGPGKDDLSLYAKRAFSNYIVHESPPFYSKCQPHFVLEAVDTLFVSTTTPGIGRYRFKVADDLVLHEDVGDEW